MLQCTKSVVNTITLCGSMTLLLTDNMSKPLTNEAVFRIEVSLSSRKSSAIVMRTQARLYTLDKGSVDAATPSKLWVEAVNTIYSGQNSSVLVCIVNL